MRDTLTSINGVKDVDVNIRRGQASLTVDTDINTPEDVAKALSTKTRGRYDARVIKKK